MDLTVAGERAYAYTGGKPFDPKLPTVTFVHGAELDHSVWALQSRYLAHHGHGVLAVDLPGHGRSSGAPLKSVAAMATWLTELLDAAGAARTALVGHSMGSLIATELAGSQPARVARLALIGSAFPMRVSDDLLEATRTDEPRAQNMVNVWSNAAFAHYPNNPGPGSWVHGVNLRLMQRQRPGVMAADFEACNAYGEGSARAAAVNCPTLIIAGSRDVMTPARAGREFAKSFREARVLQLDGAGHNLMAERPDEVLDALIAFLR